MFLKNQTLTSLHFLAFYLMSFREMKGFHFQYNPDSISRDWLMSFLRAQGQTMVDHESKVFNLPKSIDPHELISVILFKKNK